MRAEKPRATSVKKHRWGFDDHRLWDFPHVLNLKNCFGCRAAVNVLIGFEPGLSNVYSLILRHLFVISGVSGTPGTVMTRPQSLVCSPAPPNNKPRLNRVVLYYNLNHFKLVFLTIISDKEAHNFQFSIQCTVFANTATPKSSSGVRQKRASRTWAPFIAETEETGLLSQT